MSTRDPRASVWSDALDLIEQADRLHRQFFQMSRPAPSGPCWEPPVDILQTDDGIVVLIALPGVRADDVEVVSEAGALSVRGVRPMPSAGGRDAILRMEIPYGRFERRLQLPGGRYELAERSLVDGCLRLRLHRLA